MELLGTVCHKGAMVTLKPRSTPEGHCEIWDYLHREEGIVTLKLLSVPRARVRDLVYFAVPTVFHLPSVA